MPIRPQHPDDIHIVVARYNEDISNFVRFNPHLFVYNKGDDNINPNIDPTKIIKLPNLGREAGTYIYHILQNYDNLAPYIIFTQANPCDHIALNDPYETFAKIEDVFSEYKTYKFKYLSGHNEPIDQTTLVHRGCGINVTPIELGSAKSIIELINEIEAWTMTNCPDEIPKSKELIQKLHNMINTGKHTIWHWEFNLLVMSDGWFLTSGNGDKMRWDICLNFPYEKIMGKINQPGGYSFGYGAIFIAHRDQIRKYSREYWQRLYDSLQEILPGSGWGCEKLWRFLLEE